MEHWPSVDKFVCISLREATERRRSVQLEFDRVGLKVHFIISDRPANSNGYYGCYTSHQKALRQAKDEGLKRICVFEDDLYFLDVKKVHEAASIFERFASTTQWDAFLLGWYPLRAEKTSDKDVLRVLCGGQAHAYIANTRLIQRGLPDVSSESPREVDMFMFCSDCAEDKRYLRTANCSTQLEVFALRRMIALQPMDTTSIVSTKAKLRQRLLVTKLFPPDMLQHIVVYIPTLHFCILSAVMLFLTVVAVVGFTFYGCWLLARSNQNKG